MEITPTLIYFVMQASNIAGMFGLLSGVGAVIVVVSLFNIDFASHKEEVAFHKRWLYGGIVSFVFFLLVAVAIPSTKTIVAMYGIPAAITVAKDVKLDATAKKAVASVNKLLDTYLEK
jgi:uncharacterized membrane protein